MTPLALLLFLQIPPWIEAARSQPVEIHAQLIPALSRQIIGLPIREMLTLRSRAYTARHWFPRFPAAQTIPAGYSAYLAAFNRPVSTIEIIVAALQADPIPYAANRRQALEEIPVRSPAQPTCAEPIVEWMKPLFDILAAEASRLYPDRESKLAALERWSVWIESPFDLLGFVDFARALRLDAPEDLARAAGLVASILTRAPAPPCGASFLLLPVNFRGAVQQSIDAFGQAPMILTAYKAYVTRLLAAPYCRATPEEPSLRREFAADFNRKLRRWPSEGVTALDPAEIARLQASAKLIDGAPPSFEEPAHVAKARKALLAQPNLETWAAFLAAWDDWSPEQLGGDLRHEDSKLSTLLSLDLPTAFQPRLTEKCIEALSTSRLKSEEPGLWAALALDWLDATRRRPPPSAPPADPALSLLWALVHGRL